MRECNATGQGIKGIGSRPINLKGSNGWIELSSASARSAVNVRFYTLAQAFPNVTVVKLVNEPSPLSGF